MPKRTSEVNVLDLAAGKMAFDNALLRRYPHSQRINYFGIEGNPKRWGNFGTGNELWQITPQNRLMKKTVNDWVPLNNPRDLEEMLKKHFQEGQMDEIHLHMPDSEWEPPANALESLKVLFKFLKPGGKLFSAFQWESPILPAIGVSFHREAQYAHPWPDGIKRYPSYKERIIREIAPSGFRLHKFAFRGEDIPMGFETDWKDRERYRGKKSAKAIAGHLSDFIASHSFFERDANFYVVLRKPK